MFFDEDTTFTKTLMQSAKEIEETDINMYRVGTPEYEEHKKKASGNKTGCPALTYLFMVLIVTLIAIGTFGGILRAITGIGADAQWRATHRTAIQTITEDGAKIFQHSNVK